MILFAHLELYFADLYHQRIPLELPYHLSHLIHFHLVVSSLGLCICLHLYYRYFVIRDRLVFSYLGGPMNLLSVSRLFIH